MPDNPSFQEIDGLFNRVFIANLKLSLWICSVIRSAIIF